MLIVLAPSIINIKVHFCGMLVLYNEGAVLMEPGKQEGPSSLGALVSNRVPKSRRHNLLLQSGRQHCKVLRGVMFWSNRIVPLMVKDKMLHLAPVSLGSIGNIPLTWDCCAHPLSDDLKGAYSE